MYQEVDKWLFIFHAKRWTQVDPNCNLELRSVWSNAFHLYSPKLLIFTKNVGILSHMEKLKNLNGVSLSTILCIPM